VSDSDLLIANPEVRAARVADRCRVHGARLARRAAAWSVSVLLATAAFPACGKKGPPLAPLLKVPVPPSDVVVRRTGGVVLLQLRIPAANTDNTKPADIRKVEVYGFTGPTPTTAEVVKYGTLVASVPVRRPPDEEAEGGGRKAEGGTREGRKGEGAKAEGAKAEGGEQKAEARRPAPPPRPPASLANGFDQGDVVTVTEVLGPQQAQVVEVKRKKAATTAPVAGDPWQPVLVPPAQAGEARLYFIVGVNHKGQRGTFSPPQVVPLQEAPATPATPAVTYDASHLAVAWAPSTDLPRPVQEPAAAGELASTPRAVRSAAGGYRVYELRAGAGADAAAASPAPQNGAIEPGPLPKALNDKLLDKPELTEPRAEFGKARCFAVTAALLAGTQAVESAPSPAACVTPKDTFPPAAPTGLAAVASEGAVSLIWTASAEADLAGYLVLRAEPGQAPKPLTPEPIKETTFRDATVAKGVRYVYTVLAVDTAGNRSAPSNAVEESAR
jgi:hypothetical protein